MPSGNLRRRAAVNRLVDDRRHERRGAVAVVLLGIIVYDVISHGAGALSLGFLVHNPVGFAGGGIGQHADRHRPDRRLRVADRGPARGAHRAAT